MSRDTAISSEISRRFSQFEQHLNTLFERDESFRSLCKDYQDSLEAHDRWGLDKSSVGELRQKEYAELAKELEQDIRNWLERFGDEQG